MAQQMLYTRGMKNMRERPRCARCGRDTGSFGWVAGNYYCSLPEFGAETSCSEEQVKLENIKQRKRKV